MKRLIIGLDIDGVIVDFTTAALPLLSEICKRQVLPQDLHHYDLKVCLKFDKETDDYFWERALGTELLLHAPPMPDAIKSLSRISRHEIWLVTSRPEFMRELTEKWFSKRAIKYDNLVFVENDNKITAGAGFDVFVEDYLEEARVFANAGVFTLLFNQPWNQTAQLWENCRRVYDWNGVIAEITKLEDRGQEKLISQIP